MRRRQSYKTNDELVVMAIEVPITLNNVPKVIKSYNFKPINSSCMCSPKLIEIAGHKKNCKVGHTRNMRID